MPRPRAPYLALHHRDFRRLWAAQLLSLVGSQMQVAAIHWHVYLLSHSPLALGGVGLTRVLPIVLFSLWGGLVADRYDRRRVMFVSQLALTAVAAALTALTLLGHDSLWAIYALSCAGAAASAFDNPARQALVPRLVPREDLAGALSLNLAAFHLAMIGGPAIAGLLIATSALSWIYALNALSFLGVLASLAWMHPERGARRPGREPSSPGRELGAGLRFVFATPLMVWTMLLDFLATFFSGAMTLLPIFADQLLHVGSRGYGVLVGAPALGALAGSLYTALAPLPRRQGRWLLVAVAIYGATTIVYGLSRSAVLTFLALAVGGLGDFVSTVIRQTLRQWITPDELRGRMTSIHAIFFMGGPQLGELEAGVVASLFASSTTGSIVAVVSGGLATLAVVMVVAWVTPVVREYELGDDG